jgi:hypothetical protein
MSYNKEHETQNIINLHKKKIHNNFKALNVFYGFILFFIIFVILIPYILFKKKIYFILEGYLPNLDLVANILTWGSIGNYLDIWNNLYPPSPYSISGFLSQTAINYMALLGVTYMVAKESVHNNNIKSGWSKAFIMLLMTYLLPGQIITYIMDKLYELHDTKKVINTNLSKKQWRDAVSIFGIIITILIIFTESLILKKYGGILENIATKIINLPKIIR